MKRQLLTLSLFVLAVILTPALGQIKISGNIKDANTKEVIEYVNVSILNTDSTFIEGVITDEKGFFELNDIPSSPYILSASYIGYNKTLVNIKKTANNNNLGDIFLQTSDIALGEVTITGNSIIYKSDRQIITPSQSQIKESNNGLTLLKKLNLSRIQIDPMSSEVSILGQGEVQLRINGVQVTKDEIQAIAPEDIIRIEYHDDPSMRYNNAGAVIDYIVRRRESGGNISGNFMHGTNPKVGFAEDNISARFNHKKSEFTVSGNWRFRDIKWTRENKESFIFPSKQLDRTEIGEKTQFKESPVNTSLNYSIQEADKYVFNVRFRNNFQYIPHNYDDRRGTMYSSDGTPPIDISNLSSWRSNSPSLDIYYQQSLKSDQTLYFNLVSTYIDSKSTRDYTEQQNNTVITDINSHITGDKYSLIGEAIYEKKFKVGKLSTGLRHNQGYTKNEYSGNTVANVAMNTAETYAYAEYQLKKGKFNYSLALGSLRTYHSQEGNNTEKYIFTPTLKVSYNVTDNFFIRYQGHISGTAPSLSDLNNVQQEIDSLQIQRGNPNLRTSKYYHNSISSGFNKGIFSADIYAYYNYNDKPIMTQTAFEDGKFVRTNTNQKNFHRIEVYSTFKVKLLNEHITLSAQPAFRRHISNGNNYSHTYSNWAISASASANYKGWTASFYIQTRYNSLWAETIARYERSHVIELGYVKPKWSVGVWFFNPFSKNYFQDKTDMSELTPKYSKVHSKSLSGTQIISVKCSFNINFGRQYEAANKRMNNNDNDSGILK